MAGPDFPVAVGVLYRESKTSFIHDAQAQVEKARSTKRSLEGLLNSGHTWEVD